MAKLNRFIILTIIFWLFPIIVLATTEDLTTFTEVDPNSHISKTSSTVTLASLANNETAYLYKDYGVDYFGELIHNFQLNLTSATDGSFAILYGLSNTVGQFGAWSTGDLQVSFFRSGAAYYLQLGVYAGGSKNYTVSLGTTYYLTLLRSGIHAELRIFSDSGRTTLLTILYLSTVRTNNFRYLYAACSYNSGSATTLSGTGANYDLSASIPNANIVAQVTAYAFPNPPQTSIWHDGRYIYAFYYPNNGTTAEKIKIAYANKNDMKFGTNHYLPQDTTTVTRMYDHATYFTFKEGYKAFVTSAIESSNYSQLIAHKKDGTIHSSEIAYSFYNHTDPLSISYYPNIAIRADAKVVIVGTLQGTGRAIKYTVATNTYSVSPWNSATTIKSLSSDNAEAQPIVWSNIDTGVIYSQDNTLYYKHWDYATSTWGSEETIDTSLSYFNQFRGVVTRNQKLFVIWRELTTGNLLYRVRTSGSGGTWGNETNIYSGLPGTDTAQCYISTANLGKAEEVYVFYYNGTNIVYKIYTDGSLGNQTTLVNTPSLLINALQAPLQDATLIPVMYLTSDYFLRTASITLSPADVSSTGILFFKEGSPTSFNASWPTVFQKGNKILVSTAVSRWYGYSLAVYDLSTLSFSINPTETNEGWDGHDYMIPSMDINGYVYVLIGGRSTYPLVVKKSIYPLDNANFTLDISTWTNITPSTYGTRGYKFLYSGDDNVLYLITGDDAGYRFYIQEYRNSSWSALTTVVYLNTGDASDYAYIDDISLGQKESGQYTIHLFWSWKDASVQPEVTGGNLLQIETNYMKIVPQGNGTFLAYKADGTSLTLPSSSTNKDNVYNGASGADWVRNAGSAQIDGTIPTLIQARCNKTTPYAMNGLYLYKWNGSAWATTTIQSSDFPASITPFNIIFQGTYYCLTDKVISGITQAVVFTSTNNGQSYDNGVLYTNETFSLHGMFSSNVTRAFVRTLDNSLVYSEFRFELLGAFPWIGMHPLPQIII